MILYCPLCDSEYEADDEYHHCPCESRPEPTGAAVDGVYIKLFIEPVPPTGAGKNYVLRLSQLCDMQIRKCYTISEAMHTCDWLLSDISGIKKHLEKLAADAGVRRTFQHRGHMKKRNALRIILDDVPYYIGGILLLSMFVNYHPWLAIGLGAFMAGNLISMIVFQIIIALLPNDFVSRAMPEELGY